MNAGVNNLYTREAFLKFDLSGFDRKVITKGTLRLKVLNSNGSGDLHSLSVVSDNWSESTITNQNKPTVTNSPNSTSEQVDVGEWIEFDVSGIVRSEASQDKVLSIKIGSNGNRFVQYYSAESPNIEDRPQLILAGGTSGLYREYYTGITGRSVNDIPLNTPPTGTDILPIAEATDWNNPTSNRDWADNYGQVITTYLTPEITGEYTFWIASDDNSELHLSSSPIVEQSTKIAFVPSWTSLRQWNKFNEQKSAPILLQAGKTYFIQILQKEGTGKDNLSVGWSPPGENTNTPSEIISGAQLTTQPPVGSGIRRDYYTQVSGASTADIPLGVPPTGSDVLPSMEAYNWNNSQISKNWQDNYGQIISGHLTAPTSGIYHFWISSDDGGSLSLSSDELEENLRPIASVPGWTRPRIWDKYSSQKSIPIELTAGKKYFIRAMHKERKGGYHISVGWSKPGENNQAPSEVIPGIVLSPASVTTAQAPELATDLNNNGIPDFVELFGSSNAPSTYLDSDSDGLNDELELKLGFDPNSSSSVRSSAQGGDKSQFLELITGANPNGGLFNSNVAGTPSNSQAARFLTQAAFGPSPSEIAELQSLGNNAYERWIDQQLTLPVSRIMPYLDRIDSELPNVSNFTERGYLNPNIPFAARRNEVNSVHPNNYRTGAARLAMFAPDQLRQRLTWALLKILVAEPVGEKGGRTIGRYRDILSEHAFGKYEDILYEISQSPCMGSYLSFTGNRQADPSINRMPDENYARELMQLFSIGLWELNMDGSFRLDSSGNRIPTYSNEDIIQVARVFTGFDLRGVSGGDFYDKWQNHPLLMRENWHDTGNATSEAVYGAKEKIFLQSPYYNPTPLPAFADDPGRSGLDDVRDTCRILVNHPSCPPFVSRLLIQHLVTSNPTKAYVGRVSSVFANDGSGVRGNMSAVIKAILLDPEARSLDSQFDEEHGKLKGGVIRLTSMAKALQSGEANPALHDFTGIQMIGTSPIGALGESLGESFPSVFSFYLPEYSNPGTIANLGLQSPEFQALNTLRAVATPNFFWKCSTEGFEFRNEGGAPDFKPNLDTLETLINRPGEALDYLNQFFCHGTMSAETRSLIIRALNDSNGNTQERAELAVYLAQICPEAAILR